METFKASEFLKTEASLKRNMTDYVINNYTSYV